MTKLPKGQRFVNTAPDNFTITKAEFMYPFIARFPKNWILHNQTVVRNFPYFNELFYMLRLSFICVTVSPMMCLIVLWMG